jgi:hypothetical protein
MAAGGTGLTEVASGSITITGGPLQVNSSATAINQGNLASLTAPSITVVGAVVQGSGTITPAPVVGSALADPLAAIPVPAVAGAATAYTAPAGASALAPGVYSTITVNAGSTLTLNPGTFVITTRLNASGGTVNGAGVTLYLACPVYPAACAVGASGGFISGNLGTLTLSPPASGTYAGLTVFADRNNRAGNTFNQTTLNVTGTWYTLLESLTETHVSDQGHFGQLVIASLSTPNSTVFTAARSAASSYGSGGGSTGLTL